MSPSDFHAKTTTTNNNNNNNINGSLLPPPLKINKESHSIKKTSSSSSSSSSSSTSSSSLVNTSVMAQGAAQSNKPPQRHPVIIYTHSPKIIHTHPRDFMALVQKLTGLSRSEEDCGGNNTLPPQPQQKQVATNCKVVVGNEDNETSSVITEENNGISSIGENQVNSCFVGAPPMIEPPMNPYMTNLPVFPAPNHAEFMRSSHQPLLNYSNSLFFSHNMRSSIPSSATLEGVNEFREY